MSVLFTKALNKKIPTPLYYQLKEILLDYILNVHEDTELPIPTEQELITHYQISRPTVRQAINELVQEGYLYRIKAKGTYITQPKIEQQFLKVLDSFNNEIKMKGLVPSTKVLTIDVIAGDQKISEALHVTEGTKVIHLKRLRYANDDPIVIVDTFLPFQHCKFLLEKDLEQESLYELIESQLSLPIYRAIRNLEALLAGDYESKLLHVKKGAPIQFIKSTIYLSSGMPIEYSLAKYRGDRNTFMYEMKR